MARLLLLTRILTSAGVLLFCGACYPARIYHTTDIQGQVLDERTKMPIVEAKIVVVPYDKAVTPAVTYSNVSGRFMLPAMSDIGFFFLLLPGDLRGPAYDIKITAMGYEPRSIQVVSWDPWRGEPIYLRRQP